MTTNDPGSPGLDTGPKIYIDEKPPPLAYDPIIGEEAFSSQVHALRAMDPSKVVIPNVDCSAAAIATLQLVRAANMKARAPLFERTREAMGEHTIPELNVRGWTLWHADQRAQSAQASKVTTRVDVRLVNEGTEIRTRNLKLFDYYFGDDPRMDAELADIRRGTGFMDLAKDLTRIARHLTMHKADIAHDTKYYRAEDEGRIRGIVNEILAALQRDDESAELFDLRNRAYTRVLECYEGVKAAADLLFRASPTDLAAFPALRTAALAIANRRPSPTEEQPADAGTPATGTATTTTTTPTSSTPATATKSSAEPPPGFPGGSPLT